MVPSRSFLDNAFNIHRYKTEFMEEFNMLCRSESESETQSESETMSSLRMNHVLTSGCSSLYFIAGWYDLQKT